MVLKVFHEGSSEAVYSVNLDEDEELKNLLIAISENDDDEHGFCGRGVGFFACTRSDNHPEPCIAFGSQEPLGILIKHSYVHVDWVKMMKTKGVLTLETDVEDEESSYFKIGWLH